MNPVTLGPCQLYLGDCLEIAPTLTGIDAVISDPPYGIDFCHGGNDRSGIGRGLYSTKFNGVRVNGDAQAFDPSFWVSFGVPCALWGGNHFANSLPASSCWLVWDKRCASGHSNDFADCEIAWTNRNGVARVFRHHWDGMMRASERDEPRVHPTQKPIALIAWTIEKLGIPKDVTVCDPYLGSGTTGIACIRTGRKFIGIEIDERHFQTACERIDRELRQGILL